LNCFIKTGKDKIKKEEKSNVVYKINCSNCKASYVGQTKRKLITRLKEHKANIKKPCTELTVVSQHQLKHNHKFDWDDTIILNSEVSYYKRTVSEMIHIKKQDLGLNKQNGTVRFPGIFYLVLNNSSLPLTNYSLLAISLSFLSMIDKYCLAMLIQLSRHTHVLKYLSYYLRCSYHRC
ncbi:hypothetical protein ALC60_10894, partial [Trachymyrmex zeteki]